MTVGMDQKGYLKSYRGKMAESYGKETTGGATKIVEGHMLPFLEKNGRAGHDSSREKEILHGNDCISTENIQGPVQIVYLNAYTDHKANQEYPAQGWFCDWLP